MYGCRNENENTTSQDAVLKEKITAFVRFEEKKSLQQKSEKTAQNQTESIDEQSSYAHPFAEIIAQFMKNHQNFDAYFKNSYGDINLNIASQTIIFNDNKYVFFPIKKNKEYVGALGCKITEDLTYASFRFLDKNDKLAEGITEAFIKHFMKINNQQKMSSPYYNTESTGDDDILLEGEIETVTIPPPSYVKGNYTYNGTGFISYVNVFDNNNNFGMDGGAIFYNYEEYISPNFIMSNSDRLKYPKFTQVVINIANYVDSNPNVMKTLKQYTGLNEQQILDKLKFGKGPLIEIKPLDGAYGYHNPTTNTVQINEKYVTMLENSSLTDAGALKLFLSIVLLHEFVHYSDGLFFNWTQENGANWKIATYGFVVDHNNVKFIKN